MWPSVYLSHCLLDGPPSAPSSPALLASRASATRPSLAARIPGDEAPVVQTQAAECCHPWPPPHCHEGSAHLPEASLLAGAHPQETAARVAWNLSYGHKHLKEGALPRKQPQKAAPASLSEAIAGHQLPDSKEVPAGRLETRELQAQLSRGVGVQGPAPKVDSQRLAGPKRQ